ncbi:MAG: hypothetical protein KBS41_01265 [Oscillospiraceae bacterium]|nr:hypothetical protein [Candidatus Equicaccousia limihippi]
MEKELKLHNIDFKKFIEILDKCKGDVYLETQDGDSLNLRSKLSQMVGIATILTGASVTEATLRCENPEDETMFFRYNLYREMPDEK